MTQPNFEDQPTELIVEVPPPITAIIHLPGPQGPPGLQNVVVSPIEPKEKFLGLIWLDTS